jgi:uncharacterized protein YggE
VLARTAATAALIFMGLTPAALADTSAPATVTAAGQGSVMVTPDAASLSLSVTRSASTSASALSTVNRRVDAIVSAVRRVGVPASQIQTEGINTSCGRVHVGPKGHTHVIRRCTANESLSVSSTAAIVGQVIDTATRAGANSIDGPDFSFSNPSVGEVAAENAAIADARAQADAAAAQVGDSVTGVQSINLSPQSGTVVSSGSASSTQLAAGPSTPTTVHPGEQEVDATVTVVFTIAPIPSS